MDLQGIVDWRGNAVDDRKHGGIKAILFLYVLAVLRSCPNSANLSLVAYFHGTMHLDVVASSSVIAYLVGAVSLSSALMNFISGAYIQRTTAIFVFGPFVVLGYMLLALQAHLPSLHPLSCEMNQEPNKCEPAQGWNLTLLYLSLFMFAIGEGCMRACIPSIGGEQLSNNNETQQKGMYLSWLKFANSLGAVIGLVFLVWIDNNLGWTIGFMLSALIVLLGLFVAATGLPFYATCKPNGSPLPRLLLQILATLSKKRQAAIVDVIELQETGRADCTVGEDKSVISINGTTQVGKETEAIIRMLPIFISCLLIYLPFTLLMTLTIQVGNTMDTGSGSIKISSASLIAVPAAFHMLMQPCYRRILTPLLTRFTGHMHGITPLQRIGAGSVCGTVAAFLAALVEMRRLTVAEQHGLTSTGIGVPMSVFWLLGQFFLLSIMDAAYFGGLIEFMLMESESSPEMKQMAPTVQSLLAGFAAWLACALVQLVNRATRHGDGGRGWLDGANFNRTHLDRFFLLLAALELVALINYAFWARIYANKQRSSDAGSLGQSAGD